MLTELTCAGARFVFGQVVGEAGDGRGVAALGDEHDLAFVGVGRKGQVMVAAPARGLVDRHRGHRREVGCGDGEIDIARTDRVHAVPGFVDQPGDRGKGHLLGHGQDQRLEQQGKAGQLAEPVGLDLHDPPVGQPHPRRSDFQETFVLEEIEVPQPLGLRVMDRVRAVDTGRRKPAAGDKVDADRQQLSRRIEIDASDVPRFVDAERRFEQLVLHIRGPFAAKAEWRTMPPFSLAQLSGPAGAVKGSLRRALPALDRARSTLPPTRFSKEAVFTNKSHPEVSDTRYGVFK